jgi:hypothetical protein
MLQTIRRLFSLQRAEKSETYPIRKLLSVLLTTALNKGATNIFFGTPTVACVRPPLSEATAHRRTIQTVPVWLQTGSEWIEIDALPITLLEPAISTLQAVLAPKATDSEKTHEGLFPLVGSQELVKVTLHCGDDATYRIELAGPQKPTGSPEA